jgi:hypothetical protein
MTLPALAARFEFHPPEPLPEGVHVSVIGTFNDWDENWDPLFPEEDYFAAEIPLADGEYQYRYYVLYPDGNELYLSDAGWPIFGLDEEGNANNLLLVADGYRELPPGIEVFDVKTVAGEEAFIAGDFNMWSPLNIPMYRTQHDKVENWSRWQARVRVKRPFTYKVIVDGVWITPGPGQDEDLVADSFGGRNVIRQPNPNGDPFDYASGLGRVDEAASEEQLAAARELQASFLPEEIAKGLMKEANWHRRHGKIEDAKLAWTKLRREPEIPYEFKRDVLHEFGRHLMFTDRDYLLARDLYEEMLGLETDDMGKSRILGALAILDDTTGARPNALLRIDQALLVMPPLGERPTRAHRELRRELLTLKGQWLTFERRCDEAKGPLEESIQLAGPIRDPRRAEAERLLASCGNAVTSNTTTTPTPNP